MASVLIIEDDSEVQYVLQFMLEREGYRIITAVDGEQAEQALKDNEPTDLILLDMVLPYKNGLELLKTIKQDEKWSSVPIVMLSSKDGDGDIVKGLEGGAEDYVTKPFSPIELMARLKRHIRQ